MPNSLFTIQCPACLPGPGKPSPMMWELVPNELKASLLSEGCLLLKHWTRRHHNSHVRFQYAPLIYQGDLFYLQRWAPVEWSVVPSQLIFPHAGWPCTEKTRRNGGFLSLQIRRAIARLYPTEENAALNLTCDPWLTSAKGVSASLGSTIARKRVRG